MRVILQTIFYYKNVYNKDERVKIDRDYLEIVNIEEKSL